MHNDYDLYLGKLEKEVEGTPPPQPRVVRSQDGTQRDGIYVTPVGGQQFAGDADVDGLFGDSLSYQTYKREKFEHRLMLWYRLQGMSVKETASLTGYTPQSVSQVCKQPWFREAFCRLAKEQGKDALQTLIEGAVIPAFQRLEDLATGAESEQVRLAADKEILDRFLGKSVAKTEVKSSGSIDVTLNDISKLQEENAKVQRELAARGIGQHGTN